MALAFSTVIRFCMARLYGRAGRLAAKTGGFWPGQEEPAGHVRVFDPMGTPPGLAELASGARFGSIETQSIRFMGSIGLGSAHTAPARGDDPRVSARDFERGDPWVCDGWAAAGPRRRMALPRGSSAPPLAHRRVLQSGGASRAELARPWGLPPAAAASQHWRPPHAMLAYGGGELRTSADSAVGLTRHQARDWSAGGGDTDRPNMIVNR